MATQNPKKLPSDLLGNHLEDGLTVFESGDAQLTPSNEPLEIDGFENFPEDDAQRLYAKNRASMVGFATVLLCITAGIAIWFIPLTGLPHSASHVLGTFISIMLLILLTEIPISVLVAAGIGF